MIRLAINSNSPLAIAYIHRCHRLSCHKMDMQVASRNEIVLLDRLNIMCICPGPYLPAVQEELSLTLVH